MSAALDIYEISGDPARMMEILKPDVYRQMG